jgi:integrase
VLRKATGLVSKLNGRQPRLYDLRHTFVCRKVIGWYKSGDNVDCRVAQLSRYLGHKKVSDTYWYLTAIPELMACAANKVAEYCSLGGDL